MIKTTRTISNIIATFIFLCSANRAVAVPDLELFIPGGTYDWQTQTWVTTSSSFELYVISANESRNDVIVSMALASSDIPSLVSVSYGGISVDPYDWSYGYIGGGPFPDGLPPHEPLTLPTWYFEIHTGNYGISEMVGDVQPGPNFWNPATNAGPANRPGEVKIFHIETNAAYSFIHFDAYTLKPDGTINVFAPFSHDVTAFGGGGGDGEGPLVIVDSKSFCEFENLPGIRIVGGIDDRNTGNSLIAQAEYYWDDDPGYGNAVNFEAFDREWNSNYEQFADIETNFINISNGIHTLNIRGKDVEDNWGSLYSIQVKTQSSDFDPLEDEFNFDNWGVWGHCSGMAWANEFYWRNNIQIPHNDIVLDPPPDPNCPNTTGIPPLFSSTRLLIDGFQWGFAAEEIITRATIRHHWIYNQSVWISNQYFNTNELIEAGHNSIIYLAPPGGGGFGHAVLGYRTAELGDELKAIFVYDPNYPNRCGQGNEQGILLNVTNGIWSPARIQDVYDGYEQFGISNYWLSLYAIDLIISSCPVDLEVTTSLGDFISKDSTTNDNFIYSVTPFFGDSYDSTHTVIQLTENYPPAQFCINVIPYDTASSSSTYSLIFLNKGNINILAETDSISDIPEDGYLFSTLLSANLSGTISTPNSDLTGIPVDLVDSEGELYASITSNESGYYEFLDTPNGNYTVSISTPLGYLAETEYQDIIIAGLDVTADFNLTPIEITGEQRGLGFWKHQVHVYLSGRGHAQIPQEEFCGYLDLIGTHFNGNPINPIMLYSVEQPAAQTDSLEAAASILSVSGNVPMVERAKQHLMALLLNVASLKLSQQAAISEDGATASQAITYCWSLISDGSESNDETAKDIAEQINNNLTIAAGVIPLSTPNISYKSSLGEGRIIPSTFEIYQNFPNPFNAQTTINYGLPEAAHVSITVYDLLGRKVKTLIDATQQAGYHQATWNAADIPTGVYFYKIQAGEFIETKKLLLLK